MKKTDSESSPSELGNGCTFKFKPGDMNILHCANHGPEHRILLFVDLERRNKTLVDLLSRNGLVGEARSEAALATYEVGA